MLVEGSKYMPRMRDVNIEVLGSGKKINSSNYTNLEGLEKMEVLELQSVLAISLPSQPDKKRGWSCSQSFIYCSCNNKFERP